MNKFNAFGRAFFRTTAVVAGGFSTIIMCAVIYFNSVMPANFNVTEGDKFSFPDTAVITGSTAVNFEKASLASNRIGSNETIELKLFNIFPIKSTHISVINEQMITPGGTPFGIKLFTRGVIVIDINSVETSAGISFPAKLAGIQKGDILLSIGSVTVNSNEQVADIFEQSNGQQLGVTLKRDSNIIKTVITPMKSAIDNNYKSGLWVRDSSAGIGTMTYYLDDYSFAGLGHAICDSDTGKIMPLDSGEACPVVINSVQKGKSGTPGELRGAFSSDELMGQLLLNNEAGIFGKLFEAPNNLKSVPIRLKQSVVRGKASIICTLDGEGPKEYSINIDKIDLNPRSMTKNMVISITDPVLLEKTGGIVQGMSGSPIMQNGELVGAVTHVFVNSPQKGYAIFVENMLNFSEVLANKK